MQLGLTTSFLAQKILRASSLMSRIPSCPLLPSNYWFVVRQAVQAARLLAKLTLFAKAELERT